MSPKCSRLLPHTVFFTPKLLSFHSNMFKCGTLFGSRSFQRPHQTFQRPHQTYHAMILSASKHHVSVKANASTVNKRHVVVALGGNAILRRSEAMSVENQRRNIKACVSSMESILTNYKITLVHGNGPQVGLLALQSAEYQKCTGIQAMDLDILDAETEGMIGYMLEQEICIRIGRDRGVATLLSEIFVDPKDPAFQNPTKFIGPTYTDEEAKPLSEVKTLKKDGDVWRQVVASPLPLRLIDQHMRAVRVLTDHDCIVICAGGGGIPVVEEMETDSIRGVEAVIDKDRSAAMLAKDLDADGLLILTDVKAVATGFDTPTPKWIKSVSPEMLLELMDNFPDGSMGPKVESVVDFVVQKEGRWGLIGSLTEAEKVMSHKAGTLVTAAHGQDHLVFHSAAHGKDRLMFG